MKIMNLSVTLILGAMALSACSATKEKFDFSKKAPDEFAVVTRAPLEMPPDFNLRPPRPGAQRPQEDTAVDDARQAVFGENANQTQVKVQNLSDGEAILLSKTNANSVDPDIRQKLDRETEEWVRENTSTVNRILGKAGRKVDTPASVVDPVKESERIIQNKATGKPVTNGKTPTIEQ